ncbi:hypothetical protein [Brevibacillus porteri]|uniref:hypothetical protein n=1 Tax=Brevibacillus porteri TaxID=2126350 RepID=UPI00370AD59B
MFKIKRLSLLALLATTLVLPNFVTTSSIQASNESVQIQEAIETDSVTKEVTADNVTPEKITGEAEPLRKKPKPKPKPKPKDAYKKAKEDGDETANHSTTTKSPPSKDQDAYSSIDWIKDGELYQRRYYDGDGKAEMDIDYTNHGNPKTHPNVPHRHDWFWPPVGPPSRGEWY